MSEQTRRRFLSSAAGLAGVSAITGCLDGVTGGPPGDGADAQATFFVFGDFTSQVAGETTSAETLVPIGQHGHGWEPGPRVREDIRSASLLIHGMDGFQPWVDDILTDLDADGSDVTAVDVSAGVDLLEAGGDHGHDEDEHRDENHHSETDTHTEDGHHGDDYHHESGDDHENEAGGHDHSGMDPHFWMDPLRAKQAVENVRVGLLDIDPDNADAYAENAADYQRRLEDLHERLSSLVDDAGKSTVLLAGHDAFQYLGSRYGIRFESLTGVSPDDRPTTRDIERAQDAISTHDIEYVCADPLESQTAADQLVAETDAKEVLPLTSMPGLTDEWDESDWGYLDVMENVNLPTLEQVLSA